MRGRIAAVMTAILAMLLSASANAEKLTVWLVGDENAPKVLEPAIAAFKAKRPGVEFEVRAFPWGEALAKYRDAVATRRGPDILTGGLSYGIELGAKGGLIDLSKKAPDLIVQMFKTANRNIGRSMISTTGPVYTVPYDLSIQLQYYRTDLVSKPPATWADFIAEVQKQQAAGRKGWAQQWGNLSWLGYFPYLMQAGGALYDTDCTRATINSPEALKALQFYTSLYSQLHAPSDGWPDIETGLESGAYPLAQSGSWVTAGLDATRKKLVGKWSVAKLPAGPNGRSTAFIGGSVMGVTSFARNQDLAISFLRNVYDRGVAMSMVNGALKQNILWLPAGREDVIETADLPSNIKQALMVQLKDAEGAPPCLGWEQVSDEVSGLIKQVATSGADPAKALQRAETAMNRALMK